MQLACQRKDNHRGVQIERIRLNNKSGAWFSVVARDGDSNQIAALHSEFPVLTSCIQRITSDSSGEPAMRRD